MQFIYNIVFLSILLVALPYVALTSVKSLNLFQNVPFLDKFKYPYVFTKQWFQFIGCGFILPIVYLWLFIDAIISNSIFGTLTTLIILAVLVYAAKMEYSIYTNILTNLINDWETKKDAFMEEFRLLMIKNKSYKNHYNDVNSLDKFAKDNKKPSTSSNQSTDATIINSTPYDHHSDSSHHCDSDSSSSAGDCGSGDGGGD